MCFVQKQGGFDVQTHASFGVGLLVPPASLWLFHFMGSVSGQGGLGIQFGWDLSWADLHKICKGWSLILWYDMISYDFVTIFLCICVHPRGIMANENPYLSLFVFCFEDAQGLGFCGKLMRAVNKWADDSQLNLWLETSGARNVAIYERFGYKTMEQFTLKCKNDPEVHDEEFGMMRLARTPTEWTKCWKRWKVFAGYGVVLCTANNNKNPMRHFSCHRRLGWDMGVSG